MIPMSKGQKAVRACTIRRLNLGHAKSKRSISGSVFQCNSLCSSQLAYCYQLIALLQQLRNKNFSSIHRFFENIMH